MQRLGSDKCLGIGSSDTQAEGSMTWMIFLAASNGTLFQPLNHLPTFQSAEACYNFIALLNYKGDEHTKIDLCAEMRLAPAPVLETHWTNKRRTRQRLRSHSSLLS